MGSDLSKNATQDAEYQTPKINAWKNWMISHITSPQVVNKIKLAAASQGISISDDEIQEVLGAVSNLLAHGAYHISNISAEKIQEQLGSRVPGDTIHKIMNILLGIIHVHGSCDEVYGSHDTISDHAYMNIINKHKVDKIGSGDTDDDDDYDGSCGCTGGYIGSADLDTTTVRNYTNSVNSKAKNQIIDDIIEVAVKLGLKVTGDTTA